MAAVSPLDLLALDSLLSEEELAMREVVRRAVDEHVRPYVAQWFEDGRTPTRELAKRFGGLGLLGMHLTGYGCAGTSAVAYGLACMELEAGDSGVRPGQRVGWRCSRSGVPPKRRSRPGCRGWRPVRPSGFGLTRRPRVIRAPCDRHEHGGSHGGEEWRTSLVN
jgi:hypothetical protein